MGFYERKIFPILNDKLMADPRLDDLRKEILANARGRVLEIGVGSGLNLPYYPAGITELVGIDPNPGMNDRARRRSLNARFPVQLLSGSAESLPFEAASFDTAVSTMVLCSIPDRGRAIAELRRVLQPNGRFVFVEHGLSDNPKVQVWQRRLNPIQRVLACGCQLDTDVRALIEGGGFRFEHFRSFPVDGIPKTHGFLSVGSAVPVN